MATNDAVNLTATKEYMVSQLRLHMETFKDYRSSRHILVRRTVNGLLENSTCSYEDLVHVIESIQFEPDSVMAFYTQREFRHDVVDEIRQRALRQPIHDGAETLSKSVQCTSTTPLTPLRTSTTSVDKAIAHYIESQLRFASDPQSISALAKLRCSMNQ